MIVLIRALSNLSLRALRDVAVLAGVIWASTAGSAAWASEAPPHDLALWGLHCFCLTARHTPQGVVRADDNGRILWRARDGVTQDTLRAEDLTLTDSQLLLLRTYGLLAQDGARLTTAFPALGPEVMLPLRARLRLLARDVAPRLAPDAAAIVDELSRAGRPEHGYAVVFGYALDGLVWDDLRRRNALPETTLDLDHPIWRGAFWAIDPERAGTPGTNEDSFGDVTLVSVWTDQTVAPLKGLVASLSTSADQAHQPDMPQAIPVIDDVPGDPIHDHAEAIAAAAATALIDSPEGSKILASVPKASRGQAVLIVAHEFIWDLIERLVELKAVKTPSALMTSSPSAAQLHALLFLRVSTPHLDRRSR